MKKISIILALFTGLFISCENNDFGNLNDNPNGAQERDLQALMAGSIVRYTTLTGRDLLLKPTLYVQYQSQRVYVDEQNYNQAPASWNGFYVQTLSNLDVITNYFETTTNPDPKILLKGSAKNQLGVAKIMKAIIWKRVTDTWGDAPYEQAFKGILIPTYSTQEFIYKSEIASLIAARDMINVSELPPTGDLIYDGDMLKWKKLANSMIMSMSIQLSKKYPAPGGYAAVQFNNALSNANGSIENVADEAWFAHTNVPGFENPYIANRRNDYGLSKTLTDALQGEAASDNPTSNHILDNRLKIFSNKAVTTDGIPYGLSQAASTPLNSRAKLSGNIWVANAPTSFMTASYTYLNRAEAAALGWTSENALNLLEMGITKSFESFTKKLGGGTINITADGPAYALVRKVDAATNLLKVIREEKWVALFPSAFDAWSEWRRTGVPALVPSTNALNGGVIPTRYLYPSAEQSTNTANYTAGVNTLAPKTDENKSKVWWQQ
ncbi:SusD/RagB family nutrient-binding outer membrane lipoprotein [Flavobacterium sp. P4023]|uniref:SusD/RagB family nutrient-binding outer membrane lipoprotein n=1 Tax=Flavobacterium flabelliforme TaxID=2816119 RepID=A0ABS5CS59_9FLAO|nr:SusD/RagB family nutrient-binding outer membrane lipoprotein [Flavobacterium flabelliforme]MBP4141455.1 SusD/RagB family nutrient-binding outer membrane lipoprotein [Flavobacterium flabelliforme]